MLRSFTKTCVRAGVVALLLSSATVSRADTPPRVLTEEQQTEARTQFTAGVNLLDDPEGAKYEEAHRAFLRVYEITGSPKVLGNIAFCAFHLERDGEAIDAYTTYLREVQDIDARERAQIQRDLGTMTATVGRAKLVVGFEGKSFTLIDRRTQTRGAVVENAYTFEGKELDLRLRPGRHTFVVKSSDGIESQPVEATIEPGGSTTFEFVPPKPQPAAALAGADRDAPEGRDGRRSSYVGPIVLGAVGLAGIATGVVTGVLAKGKEGDIADRCPGDECPASYTALADDRTSAKTFGTIADIGFISGGALLAGALVWFLVTPSSGGASPSKTATRTAAWLPSAGCGGDSAWGRTCGLQLKGGF